MQRFLTCALVSLAVTAVPVAAQCGAVNFTRYGTTCDFFGRPALLSGGFDPASWDALVTSGEVAWHILHQRRSSTSRERCYLIARDRDSSAILGLGFDPAPSPAEADLILIAGSEGDRRTLADYAAELEPAARTGVPALCTNPDDVMLTRVGPRFGAGRIAALYRDMGGTVTMFTSSQCVPIGSV